MNLAQIEQLKQEMDAIDHRRDEVMIEIEKTIVEAHQHEAPVSHIAAAAGMSRPKVYGILHRYNAHVDTDLGRRLVQNRWHQARTEPAPDRDLFAPPAPDDPIGTTPEDEMSVLDFLALYRAEQRVHA